MTELVIILLFAIPLATLVWVFVIASFLMVLNAAFPDAFRALEKRVRERVHGGKRS